MKTSSLKQNTTDSERTKEIFFPCLQVPREVKNTPFIYPALKTPILIRNESLSSEDSKAKKSFVNILHAG